MTIALQKLKLWEEVRVREKNLSRWASYFLTDLQFSVSPCENTNWGISDPFFLDDDHVSDVEIIEKETTSVREKLDPNIYSVQANKSSATDGNGPTPRRSKNIEEKSDSDWEWDGTVDEDAHLGLEQ